MWRFQIFNVPVAVQPWFWIIAALIGLFWARNELDLAILVVGVTFVSFLAHELGHALAARRYGARPGIVLHGIGGTTSFMGGRFDRKQQIFITIAGPLAGFAAALVFYIAFWAVAGINGSGLLTRALSAGVLLNVLWNVLNLMPVMPMDGGQILRDILGPGKQKTTAIVGAVTGAVLCVVSLAFAQIFIAIAFGLLAFQNYRNVPMQGGVDRR